MANQEKLLIIVESPSKTKTISKYIDNAKVIASIGHFKDLPKKELGIDIEKDFEMNVQTLGDRKKFITELKNETKNADRILIATDPDREGEAIAAHIAEEIDKEIERVEFTEITKNAVTDAITNSRTINYALVDAQKARRAIDRLVGFKFSPVLWQTLRNLNKKGLSAGRVQSVALKMLVEREKERNRFVENKFFAIEATLYEEKDKQEFKAKLVSYDEKSVATNEDFGKFDSGLKNKDLLLIDKKKAEEIAKASKENSWNISNIESKPTSSSAPPPFTTSTLQQDASRRFGYSPKRTMVIAQKLYEQGFITYMRTDSTHLSTEALAATKDFVENKFGKEFLPESANVYKTKVANAQEAHEAIRPAGRNFKQTNEMSGLGKDELQLYDLILNRTLASQMKPAEYIRTNVTIENGKSIYKASGNVTKFKGYTAAYEQALGRNQKSTANLLPQLTDESIIKHKEISSEEKSTTPPRRLSEAMLVKEMEARGIGRPSTYSSILDRLVKKEYVIKKNKTLIPTFIGIAVTQLLENHYLDLFNEQFTAAMERRLDSIASSDESYLDVLKSFYYGSGEYEGVEKLLEAEIDIKKACGVPIADGMEIRIGQYGPFIEKDGNNISIPEDLFLGDLNKKTVHDLIEFQEKDNVIGKNAEGENILLKVGRYGPYIELESSKIRKSIPKSIGIENVTEEIANDLLGLPKKLGQHPETNEDIFVDFGRYGPYVKCGKTNASMKANDNPLSITLEEAIELIKNRKAKFEPRVVGTDPETNKEILIKIGRFGPYVTDGKKNVSLKGYDLDNIQLEECLKLLSEKK
jgi:DNA topoisomerase-1|tara:strand:- start:1664 stop:4096 length:2433 start_codon:yes stop_codon:yes gene_type:complete